MCIPLVTACMLADTTGAAHRRLPPNTISGGESCALETCTRRCGRRGPGHRPHRSHDRDRPGPRQADARQLAYRGPRRLGGHHPARVRGLSPRHRGRVRARPIPTSTTRPSSRQSRAARGRTSSPAGPSMSTAAGSRRATSRSSTGCRPSMRSTPVRWSRGMTTRTATTASPWLRSSQASSTTRTSSRSWASRCRPPRPSSSPCWRPSRRPASTSRWRWVRPSRGSWATTVSPTSGPTTGRARKAGWASSTVPRS